MMVRIPVAIYPFCAEILPLVKVFDIIQETFILKQLVSPSGFGLAGHDAGYACNHPDVGITVTDEFDYKDGEWTTLLLIEPIMIKEEADYSYEEIIHGATFHGKRIIFVSASKQYDDKINELIKLRQDDMIELISYVRDETPEYGIERRFHDVEVPVILVGGLLEEADTFEVLLKLAEKLKSENMNPLVITKHPMGEVLGLHNINHIWNNSDYTEAEKISTINLHVNNLVKEKRPEVVLVEAPDAVLRYNDYATNGFGIRTYMFCQACSPDRFICCVPFELAVDDYLNAISIKFEETRGISITSVHASNVLVDVQGLMQKKRISIIYNNINFVKEKILKERTPSQIPIHSVILNGIDGMYHDLFEDEG